MNTYRAIQELQYLNGVLEGMIINANNAGNPDSYWKIIYGSLFGGSIGNEARANLEVLGISLDWDDPDTSYQEDAEAWIEAFRGTLRLFDEPTIELSYEVKSTEWSKL